MAPSPSMPAPIDAPMSTPVDARITAMMLDAAALAVYDQRTVRRRTGPLELVATACTHWEGAIHQVEMVLRLADPEPLAAGDRDGDSGGPLARPSHLSTSGCVTELVPDDLELPEPEVDVDDPDATQDVPGRWSS
ncbi:hypothetical protein L6R53_14040 [Myxococcota bacterium]|nr:hypothetical protein [Myxococcota bacterium]